jgi:tetrahydromethanopterin S-methyltransferase subunit B
MTGWQPPEPMKTGLPEYIGREVVHMTASDIIMIFIGIISLMVSFGSLLIALLAFLDKRNKRK